MLTMRKSLFLVLLLLFGCTHSSMKVKPVINYDVCDSTMINYTTNVVPIMSTHCYSCHSDSSTSNSSGLNLEDTARLKTYLLNDFQGDGVYGSKMLHCIMHSSGALRMPPGYKLDTCSVARLRNWLKAGAPL